MIKRLAPLLALCTLAACTTPPAPPPVLADAAVDTREWFYSRGPEQPSLVYGTPESDDVAVAMRCTPGSNEVEVMQGGLERGRGIVLVSGSHRMVLTGPTEVDELNGGFHMTARASVDHPVFRNFRDTGQLATGEGARAWPLPATPAERGWVAEFLSACAFGTARAAPGPFTPPGWRFMYPLELVVYSADAAGRHDLMLACETATARLFFHPRPRVTTDRSTLAVASGSVRAVVKADFNEGYPTSPTGEVFRDPDNAQPSLAANLPAASPVIREFLRTGKLAVSNSGRTLQADADAAELAEMRRYFARC